MPSLPGRRGRSAALAGLVAVVACGACGAGSRSRAGALPSLPPPSASVALAPLPPASARGAASAAPTSSGAPIETFDLAGGEAIGVDRAPPSSPSDALAPPPSATAAPASPRAVYEEREEPKVRERLAAAVRGMSPAGPPIDTSAVGLGAPVGGLGREVRRVRVPVARGFCYALTLRGSYDLDVSLNPQITVSAPFHEDGGELVAVARSASVVTRFCPQAAGAVVVLLWQDHRDPLPAVTHGVLRVQVFREPISTAELDARADAAARKDRRDWVRYVCGHCTRVFLACKLAGEAGCARQQDWCMQQGKVTPAECEGAEPGVRPAKPPWDI